MTTTPYALPDPESDALLVRRARAEPAAFGLLYDRYLPGIYRYHFRRTGAHADAEDLTAQTFHRALERLATYEDRGLSFGAWLFRIAHNLLADRYRRRRPSLSLDQISETDGEPGDPDCAVDEALLRQEELDAAWAAVARLPQMQQRAVTLYFARGLTHAETGRLIGRSEAATKQLIYRAVQTLRRQLAAREGGERDDAP
jgi:RNA polymerase sigma-70 factor, ECF subfamily